MIVCRVIEMLLMAIGGGLAVSKTPKIGLKRMIAFLILSGVIGLILFFGVDAMFLLKGKDSPYAIPIAGVFFAMGFTGTLHLCIVRYEEKVMLDLNKK